MSPVQNKFIKKLIDHKIYAIYIGFNLFFFYNFVQFVGLYLLLRQK